MLINRTSLSLTVEAVNAAQFEGRALSTADRGAVARWIAARQGLPGAYGGTFAGFPAERSKGIVLFTGERIASAYVPHFGKLLDLQMLVLTPRGRERTKTEFAALLQGAGFRLSRVTATEGPLSVVEAVKA